jgi:hypothetical protein
VTALTPRGRARHYPPGEGVDWSRPGDFILVCGTSWRSRIVSEYERRRASGPDERLCARWSHAAVVVGTSGAIVEAGTAGVMLQRLEKYRPVDYHYVAVAAAPGERSRAARFALSHVGRPYNRLGIAGLAVSWLTRERVWWPEPSFELCGSLVAHALACAGERFERLPAQMLPSDLAIHYGVIPDGST